MVGLILVDAGRTVGTFDPPSTFQILKDLSGFPDRVVAEESRRFLHTAPELTDEIRTGVCNALLIDPGYWPNPWPYAGFTPYHYARDVLAELSQIAPIAVISNIPVTCGPTRMDELATKFAPYISAVYPSYRMGMRKPDRRLFEMACADHGVPPEAAVHIGDQWINDVRGAVKAGCRGIYVNTRGVEPPPRDDWPATSARIALGQDLRDALTAVHEWNG